MKEGWLLCAVFALFIGSVAAQTSPKPWMEWSKKDAEKLLNDSPWAQTQTDKGAEKVDTTVTTATSSARGGVTREGESGEGATSKATYFRVRFLTAKPIREAFARMVILSQTAPNNDLPGQLQGFIDRDFGDYLVIAFSVDAEDKKMGQMVTQMLGKLTAETLKDKVYLERKDGKRLALMDYKAPIADSLGAKLIFPRSLDGQLFLSPDSDSVRFVAELNPNMKVNLKFKVSSMTYGSKLEY